MPRYRLTIAYDGTDFCGWQKQEPPEGVPARSGEGVPARAAYAAQTPRMDSTREGRVALRTVQGVVEQAVREVVREPVELIGASRTDSGVHARGQVAAFSCEPRSEGALGAARDEGTGGPSDKGRDRTGGGASPLPGTQTRSHCGWPLARGCDRLAAAINSRLPEDVIVLGAEAVEHGFDPIDGALAKGYTYTFHVARERPLWDRRFVHHVWDPRGLDVEAMNAAAAVLVGEHDFAAFAAAGHGRLSTVRTVFSLQVEEIAMPAGDTGARRVRMSISGNGFLWNMVRIIAGTLMQVGLGQRTTEDVRRVLEARDRAQAGPTLPATGLCLEWIRYDAQGAKGHDG